MDYFGPKTYCKMQKNDSSAFVEAQLLKGINKICKLIIYNFY